MEFAWLASQAVEAMDNLLRFRTIDDQFDFENTRWLACNIASDILRKLGVEERREAVQYLQEKAPEVADAIRKLFPHRI